MCQSLIGCISSSHWNAETANWLRPTLCLYVATPTTVRREACQQNARGEGQCLNAHQNLEQTLTKDLNRTSFVRKAVIIFFRSFLALK
uniref:Secreted protein n=1 Tax=Mesocestoides corti TaxID=53468 RepID=A0A5K3G2F0_MESCO